MSQGKWKGEKLAVVSLVCGLPAAFVPLVGAVAVIPAIVLGHMALARIREPLAPDDIPHGAAHFLPHGVAFLAILKKARGRAIWGLSMGYFGLGMNILVLLAWGGYIR